MCGGRGEGGRKGHGIVGVVAQSGMGQSVRGIGVGLMDGRV